MDRDTIKTILTDYLSGKNYSGKVGSKLLQPEIANELQKAGLIVDCEDSKNWLQAKIPVWRSKDTGLVVETKQRRRIDIVAYDVNQQLVALIELESDLDDLREEGVSKRSGHYDVWSIARNHRGDYFDSYNSIERMAVAAYALYMTNRDCIYPTSDHICNELVSISSKDKEVHNPLQVPMFLVAGRTRDKDCGILEPRLKSLGTTLLSPQLVS